MQLRVYMRALFSLPLLSLLACGGNAPELVSSERFSCSASALIDRFNPAPTVAFVSDSTPALRAWRENVGDPVVDRAGRVCEDAPLDSILVVSWNVHLGHADVIRFIDHLRAGRIVPGVRVQHFVILVQEAFRAGDEVPARARGSGCTGRIGGVGADIDAIADSLGLALFYVPSMRNGCDEVRQDRGNAILSTVPLTNLRAIELPLVRQRRVAASADVKGTSSDGNEWTLSLTSVHLENRGSGLPRNWIHGRAKQAQALVAALPNTSLAALGGDFNTLQGPKEPAIKIVGGHFKNSPEHQTDKTFTSYVVMRSHLDYLFFRCAGEHRSKYWRAAQRYGSDHYPIMGFVRVASH